MTEDLMIVEFTEEWAGYEIPKVVMFNRKHISEEEVYDLIKSGKAERSEDVVIMTKQQYLNLGGNIQNVD